MGSAMAKVFADCGHDVRLWGTWLDDAMLEPCERGDDHPRLKLRLDKLKLYRAARLEDALLDTELVVSAVSSEGVVPVWTKAAPLMPDVPVLSPTKGFLESHSGKMARIDQAVSEVAGRPVRYVHAAGPAKAVEIARHVPTLMTFGGEAAPFCARAMGAPHMHISTTADIAGAEVCSALKNAYATGLGIWDGLLGADAHNARAAWFTQAIDEMARVVVASGGRIETAYGGAGVGDLHVTAAAGRNRLFGEHIGRGRPAKQVAAELGAIGQLTEGYPAIKSAWLYTRQLGVERLPLLKALYEIVWDDRPVQETVKKVVLTV
jgi:glycerol-3-phosphate dehydrogenase (NAD(P)+)